MHDPKVLATFALNYETNEPIPAELVQRANRADAFGRGLWARFQLVYTSVSFDLHNIDARSRDRSKRVWPDSRKRFVPYTTGRGRPSDRVVHSPDGILVRRITPTCGTR